MKRPIKSFKEAKARLGEVAEAVGDIADFLKMADERIAAVNMLKGEVEPDKLTTGEEPDVMNHQNGDVPPGWAERILHVFNTVKKTMKPHNVMAEYQRFRWPRPENDREFYKRVYSALHYLTNKKSLLVQEDDGGFRLKT